MLSEDIRARLEKLNRTRLPDQAPHSVKSEVQAVESEVGSPPQGQRVHTPWGPHWLFQQALQQLWPQGPKLLAGKLATETPSIQGEYEELDCLQHTFPHHTILLDLETCGFAGSIIFLAGVIHSQDGELVLSQLWARDYSEEKALLHSLWTLVHRARLLITFNGKSFDWPQVQDRSTLHLLGQKPDGLNAKESQLGFPDSPFEPIYLSPNSNRPTICHFDLLHHARRRWKSQLPNCKLQTLERYICGRKRVDDIPGRDIPQAYHDYVRTGREHQTQSILHHNALDLVTLLQLSLTFIGYQDHDRRAAS